MGQHLHELASGIRPQHLIDDFAWRGAAAQFIEQRSDIGAVLLGFLFELGRRGLIRRRPAIAPLQRRA